MSWRDDAVGRGGMPWTWEELGDGARDEYRHAVECGWTPPESEAGNE